MSISERTLRKWRKEALKWGRDVKNLKKVPPPEEPRSELIRKILEMTRELLDQHLLKK